MSSNKRSLFVKSASESSIHKQEGKKEFDAREIKQSVISVRCSILEQSSRKGNIFIIEEE